MPAFFKKTLSAEDDFKSVHSTLKLYSCEFSLNENLIETLAKRWIFSGKSFSDICINNEKVCQELGLPQKAQTWMILRFLFSEINIDDINCTSSTTHPSSSDIMNNMNRCSVLDS